MQALAVTKLEVNGRAYAPPPQPVAVICIDGCDPEYLAVGLEARELPFFAHCTRRGHGGTALAAMPTFTNPNNLSLVTGVPPAVHGVSGNFYLDRASGETVMITGDAELRVPTILAAMAGAGVPTAVITAKDKLRAALAKGLPIGDTAIAASAQHAAAARRASHGIDDLAALLGREEPDQYSADLSLFVLDAGLALLRQGRARLLYLSLSDYVQHRHAPDSPEARGFMRAVDARLGALVEAGCLVAATADHGMSDMARADGSPDVVFIGDLLDARFGAGTTTVICPITDPFVRHHGALGGLVRVHLLAGAPSAATVIDALRAEPRLGEVLHGAEACARYDLAPEMEGDVTVIARAGVALGSRAAEHDLGQLDGVRLRSHGGLAEQKVPFVLSAPLDPAWLVVRQVLRNYDIFDAALNGVAR
ncbi:Phosphonoacetate hydrolase [Rhodovastum atsumiense]|uniref:Phosphonoacetate hydrolase n=1 Tax=Rhodovastum atsumiense TaxID=504468 RepID=A0A5M6IQ37_9PROT|nr:phosphonoacetate hydrolase [Rhodovastum atsumiense]KAA5610394.1 phosphonoacetate hydrolase [Rhodovastum atsumiense]CAH2602927.1 Phosphonoacetate hydrolase [Rhodovastum atsumiense]